MLRYSADFETTTQEDDVRVWASCLVDIETLEVVHLENNIESLFDFLKDKNSELYYHNLKFDGEFIIAWLLNNGYEHNDTKKPKTFQTLITDMGVFYSITVYFAKHNKRYEKCVIFDSHKKLPMSVSAVAKAFNLPISKLEIDYKAYREPNHELTLEEREYIINDTMIMAMALNHQFKEGLTRMTIGSDALHGYKLSLPHKHSFENYFPVLELEVDKIIRESYKGGVTYLNPKYKNKRIKGGKCYDVNSLYPWAMRTQAMPYGYPIRFEGKYVEDKRRPLYIIQFECAFEIKPGHLPTVQLKNNLAFIPTEYLTTSNEEIVPLTMTSVDLKLFLEHYDVYCLTWYGGFKFKSCTGAFNSYIDHWMHIKEISEGGTRLLAKLMLNNLYGKFAKNPKSRKKTPYLDENGVVKYQVGEIEWLEPVYTAVGSFITAYAREKTLRTAQSMYDRFIYCDTDSLHLEGMEEPDIEIHPTHLGAWKHEYDFIDSKFIRAKTYMETMSDGKILVKCAGMPENVKKLVTYNNFKEGSIFNGKLSPKRFKGGVVLRETTFKIKEGK